VTSAVSDTMMVQPIRPDVAATRAAAGRPPSNTFAALLEAGTTAQPGTPADRTPQPDRRDGAAASSSAGARAAVGADRQGRDSQAVASDPFEASADQAAEAGQGTVQGQATHGNQAPRDTRNDPAAADPVEPMEPTDAAAEVSAAADAAATAAAEDAAAAVLVDAVADMTDAASPEMPGETDGDKPEADTLTPAVDPTLALLMTGQLTPVVAAALAATLPDAAAAAAGTSTDASAAIAIDPAQGQSTPATQALIAAAAAAAAASTTSPPLTQAAPAAIDTGATADAALPAGTAPTAEMAAAATASAAPPATDRPENPPPQPVATAPSDATQPKASDITAAADQGVADANRTPSHTQAPREPALQPQPTETARPPARDAQPEPAAAPARNEGQPQIDPKQAAILVQQSGALQTPATVHQQHAAGRPPAAEAGVPLAGVAVQIAARALNGERSFDIRLDPPELGRVDVKLHVDAAGKVTSHLVVDRPETLDLLKRDAPALERALHSAGLKTDDNGSLQFSLRDQSFFGRDHGTPDRQAPASQLIVPDDDVPVESAVRGYGRLLGLGSGVDIRV
jgi:flagellar hook-length control protein FliK